MFNSIELQAEIAEETKRVCNFLIDRELEAPERFHAIQSFRAAMAILRQQAVFISEMHASGLVNDTEHAAMQAGVRYRSHAITNRL